jgi:hypothetical protein
MEIQAIVETIQQFFTQEGQTFSIWQQLLAMLLSVLAITAATFSIVGILNRYLGWVHRRQVQFVKNYEFPNSVRVHLTNTFPTLTDEAIETIFNAFRSFISICRYREDRFVAMPSKFVDAAWHGFVLETEEYQTFCKRSIGRFLHHHPQGSKKQNDKFGIARAFDGATKLSAIGADQLPTLFLLDSLYGHPQAIAWDIEDLKKESAVYAEHLKEQKRLEEKRRTEGADGSGGACGCGGSC